MKNAEHIISVFLRKDSSPHFLDLSGAKLFDFYFDIKRNPLSDTDDRDLTFLVNESVFDIPYAFEEGLLELIDVETGAVVVWPTGGKPLSKRQGKKFITLSPPINGGTGGDSTRSIPFQISYKLNSTVQPGQPYRVVLRDLDLNVKWWSFNPPDNLTDLDRLPTSEKGKLVAKTTTNKFFRVVPSIGSPPPISISISLSTSKVSYRGPTPRIRISIVNKGSTTVTVKSSGEQPYISTRNVNPRDPRITCPKSFHSLKNFTITNSRGDTIMNILDSPSAMPLGLSKTNFTALEPGRPLVMEAEFLTQSWIREKLKKDGSGPFTLRLKRREAWCFEGSIDELFGEKEKLTWDGLFRSACLPVALEAEDEVLFEIVD